MTKEHDCIVGLESIDQLVRMIPLTREQHIHVLKTVKGIAERLAECDQPEADPGG